jgi:hypothetical protein
MDGNNLFFGAFAQSRKTLLSSCQPLRLSAFISASPTGRISVKFDVADVYGNLPGKSNFVTKGGGGEEVCQLT